MYRDQRTGQSYYWSTSYNHLDKLAHYPRNLPLFSTTYSMELYRAKEPELAPSILRTDRGVQPCAINAAACGNSEIKRALATDRDTDARSTNNDLHGRYEYEKYAWRKYSGEHDTNELASLETRFLMITRYENNPEHRPNTDKDSSAPQLLTKAGD